MYTVQKFGVGMIFFSLITDLIKTIVKLYNCIVPVTQW